MFRYVRCEKSGKACNGKGSLKQVWQRVEVKGRIKLLKYKGKRYLQKMLILRENLMQFGKDNSYQLDDNSF